MTTAQARALLALAFAGYGLVPAAAIDRGPPAQSLGGSSMYGSLTCAPGKKCEIGGFSVTVPGGIARTLVQQWSDEINLKNILDGVCTGNAAIDTAAMNTALAQAAMSGGTGAVAIHAPACTYKLTVPDLVNDPTGTIGFRLPSNATLRGDGPKTIFTWNDTDAHHLFGSAGSPTTYATGITFRDFKVRGTGDVNAMANAYPFIVYYVDGLRFEGVISEYSRVMGIAARSSTNVTVERSTVRFAKRDGINLSQCSGTAVRDNDAEHIDDDAISVSSSSADPQKVRTGDVITGNRIADAQGIRALGARKLTIAGNQLARIRQHMVDVSTLPADGTSIQEGVGAAVAITITGNTFTDLIDRQYVDNLNHGASAIYVNGVSARQGTYPVIPGEPNPATGTARNPAFEVFANSTSATVPTPASAGYVIAGNVFKQTLPPSDGTDARFNRFSDYGFGKIWTRTGWLDPSLPATAFRGSAVQVSGGIVRDLSATGNVISGYGYCLNFSQGVRYDNITFAHNTCTDISQAAVVVNTAGRLQAFVDFNTFDLDPYLQHANRGANGTWKGSNFPYAFYSAQGSGVFARNNIIRNAGGVTNFPLSTAGWYFAENIGEADLQNTGFNAGNKGIGYFPENSGKLRYARVGSDPTSADFGTVLTMPSYP